MQQLVATPPHVPADRVVGFDFYDIPNSDKDIHLALKTLHDGPDIFWTPHNGGHWVAIRAEDVEYIQRNWRIFSHKSTTIPRNATPSLPLELDPPEHTPIRALVSPLFAPSTLADVEARAREFTINLIDSFYKGGRCEFSSEFARKLPIRMFLYLVDLPYEDAPMLLELAEVRVRSSDAAARDRVKAELIAYLGKHIDERRANPGADFISKILVGDVGGRTINDIEAQNLLATLMFGGLDTVASMLGFVMRFLAQSPAHRQQLIDEPKSIPTAVNELIRRHGLTNTARLVVQDHSYGGVEFRVDDRVQVINALAGLDERKYPHPLEVDFKRANASTHAVFGNGPHRCPGANLARTELKVVLEEWLARIPNFEIDPDDRVVLSTGLVNAVSRLPLRWQVGRRSAGRVE